MEYICTCLDACSTLGCHLPRLDLYIDPCPRRYRVLRATTCILYLEWPYVEAHQPKYGVVSLGRLASWQGWLVGNWRFGRDRESTGCGAAGAKLRAREHDTDADTDTACRQPEARERVMSCHVMSANVNTLRE